MGAGLDLSGDWVGAMRAMYESGDDASWAETLLARVESLIPHPLVGIQWAEFRADGRVERVVEFSPNAVARDAAVSFSPLLHKFEVPAVRSFFFPKRSVVQVADVLERIRAEVEFSDAMHRWMRKTGVVDGFATTVQPVPGTVVTLYALTRGVASLSAPERAAMTRLGLHIEASVRLRKQPEKLVAILGPRGEPEYLREDVSLKQLPPFSRSTPALDADALGLWRALAAGALSVVQRTEGRRELTYFYENPPHRQPLHALTDTEQDIVGMVCQGYSAKAIAYGLGISEATVSTRLKCAAQKVGLSTRLELVRLAAMITRDPRARFTETTLTTAENDVLELLSRGLTNAQIAAERNRSVRTIANQVASLLTKTDSPNRKALAAWQDNQESPA